MASESKKSPASPVRENERRKAIDLAVTTIEKQFGKGAILTMTEDAIDREIGVVPSGSPESRHRARHRRLPARARRRDLRAGVERQDDARAARDRGDPEAGRRRGVHRRRARARRRLRAQARREGRGAAGLAARHRRAGAGDRRHAAALRRGGHGGHRLGGGAGAEGRDRGRDGRLARRSAGAADEPGAAQAHRHGVEVERDGDLHQPDPHEDRRDVRQPGDDDRRQRAQVLRVGAPRRAPHRGDQGAARRWSATARASRW